MAGPSLREPKNVTAYADGCYKGRIATVGLLQGKVVCNLNRSAIINLITLANSPRSNDFRVEVQNRLVCNILQGMSI